MKRRTKLTREMKTLFVKRTRHHISLVRANLLVMVGYKGIPLKDLAERAVNHDQSKWSEAEAEGYTWLNWKYHLAQQKTVEILPEKVDATINKSWKHHVTTNRHHPEFFNNCNEMSDLDIVEMVCDWTAMAQELEQNNGSARPWAQENIPKKWNFSEGIKSQIFSAIDELDRRNARRQTVAS